MRAAIVCLSLGVAVAVGLEAFWPSEGELPPAQALERTANPPPAAPVMSPAVFPEPAAEFAVAPEEVTEPVLAEPEPLAESSAAPNFIRGRLQPGDSLVTALGRHGVPGRAVSRVAIELRPLFDFHDARPGDHYQLTRDTDGRIIDFRYVNASEEVLHLHWTGTEYLAEVETTEFVTRRSRIAGVIESSLYDAIATLGEKPYLATTFASLFTWETDINGRAQSGDGFQAIYERRYRLESDGSETYLGPGRILAARYQGRAGDLTAVYFAPDDERPGGYFRPDGTSLEREFLANPVELGRIASSWSAARAHPILEITRPHYGVDYAAPLGTPVWAAARGMVAYRGWAQGFGNLVKIRHDNGYLTYYGHLSAFAKDLVVGKRLRQKDVIGYVGKTGLATGPHVCFRVRKDGQYVNPLTLEAPIAAEVAKSDRVAFRAALDDLLGTLDGQRLASATGDKAL
ncbi:MAG: peptidoglycan DD-metalloendopeptidase family protein [Myxococcota bacterium]